MTENELPGTPAEVAARISSLLPSLLPAERQVAQVLLDRAADAAELSSQQVADLAATSRATVVRAAQSLGYSGYQQLRVLLARDALLRLQSADAGDHGVRGVAAGTFAYFHRIHDTALQMTGMLDADEVGRAVSRLAAARRILVVGHGLSRSLSVDVTARLVRLGLQAEQLSDRMDQLVVTRLLGPSDLVLVISGSGAHSDSLALAREAAAGEPGLIVITAFARSPIAQLADILLVVGMPNSSFTDELTYTTRIPQAILVEGLMASLRDQLGERGRRAAAVALSAVSDHVHE